VDRAQREQLRRDLGRLADGDRDAFHPVFVGVWPVIRRFALRQLSPADADDVAQEALLRVFRRASEFDVRRDALAWVLGITAYEIKTLRRKRQRRRETTLPEDVEAVDGGLGPDQTLLAQEDEASIRATLLSLGVLDAETLAAFAAGERPALAPATFRKRVQRALTRLRAAWRTRHGHD
jgi:RNA polymerase sigma-70 factor, ECF subfamily